MVPVPLAAGSGSTLTEVAAVGPCDETLAGVAQIPPTSRERDMVGSARGLVRPETARANTPGDIARRLACSSAGGGSRAVAIGPVPGSTAETAHRAALRAGAKVFTEADDVRDAA